MGESFGHGCGKEVTIMIFNLWDTISSMDYSFYVILLELINCIFPRRQMVKSYYSPNLMSHYHTQNWSHHQMLD